MIQAQWTRICLSIHLPIYAAIQAHLLIHPPTHPTTHPSTHTSTHPYIHSPKPIHSFIHPYSPIHPLIRPFIHPFIHPLIYLSTHPLIYLSKYQSINPPTYPSSHPPNYPSIHPLFYILFFSPGRPDVSSGCNLKIRGTRFESLPCRMLVIWVVHKQCLKLFKGLECAVFLWYFAYSIRVGHSPDLGFLLSPYSHDYAEFTHSLPFPMLICFFNCFFSYGFFVHLQAHMHPSIHPSILLRTHTQQNEICPC